MGHPEVSLANTRRYVCVHHSPATKQESLIIRGKKCPVLVITNL